jgi:hypothetical protein
VGNDVIDVGGGCRRCDRAVWRHLSPKVVVGEARPMSGMVSEATRAVMHQDRSGGLGPRRKCVESGGGN